MTTETRIKLTTALDPNPLQATCIVLHLFFPQNPRTARAWMRRFPLRHCRDLSVNGENGVGYRGGEGDVLSRSDPDWHVTGIAGVLVYKYSTLGEPLGVFD